MIWLNFEHVFNRFHLFKHFYLSFKHFRFKQCLFVNDFLDLSLNWVDSRRELVLCLQNSWFKSSCLFRIWCNMDRTLSRDSILHFIELILHRFDSSDNQTNILCINSIKHRFLFLFRSTQLKPNLLCSIQHNKCQHQNKYNIKRKRNT